jgi:hypothetical protein
MLTRGSAAPTALVSCLLASAVAFADPVALWTFDQPGDPSPGITGGSLVGEAVSGNATQRQIGAGSYFGNNGSYLSAFGQRPDTTRAWSISTWVRSDTDTGTTDAICSWYPAVGFSGHVLRNNSGRVFFELGTAGYQWSPTTVFNRQWHHLVLTSRNGGAPLTLYIDGVAAASPTPTTVSASTDFDSSLRIGASLRRNASNVSDWDGWIDDFGVINRNLAATEAALIHGLGRFGIGLAEFPGASALLGAPAGTVAIIAGKPWEAVASGLPGAAGSVAGSLAGGDASIVIASGRGLRMLPVPSPLQEFTTTPASLSATVGTGGTRQVQLQLANPAANAPLRWTIAAAAGAMPPLGAIDANFDSVMPAIAASLSGLTEEAPEFPDGEGMASVAYEGQGNRHDFMTAASSSEFPIPLMEGKGVRTSLASNGEVLAQVRHTQRSGPGYFLMSADLESVSQLRVTGTTSFFDYEAYTSSSTLTVHGIPWKVWIYRISSPEKPVVHHVFITPPDGSIEGSVQAFPAEHFLFTGFPSRSRIHHLWFIRDFDVIEDAVLLETARNFLRHTHAPASWLRFGAVAGSLPASTTGDIPIDFDSAGLAPGIYQTRFAVIPSGSDVSEAPATRFHDARLEVLAPQFTASGPAAGLKLLSGIEHRTQKIKLTPVAGFSFGTITATSDAPWLRAIPSENRIGEVDLVFDTAGLAGGTHRAKVTVSAGVTVQVIEIEIEIHNPEIRQILPDPFRDRMYLLHEGSSHAVNSRILVLKASDGTFVRELDVGRVYRIAQTPDGKRLYGLRQPDHAIVPVDLQRMLVEAPLALPAGVADDTPFSDLEAGENGILYFINRAYAGKLHAYDAKTRKLLQTIAAPQDATAFFSRIKLSPDRKELWASQAVSDSFTGPFQPLTRYSVDANGSLSPLPALSRSLITPPNLSGDLEILSNATGRRIALSNTTFAMDDLRGSLRLHPERIRAIAPDGEFLIGTEAIYPANGLRKLANMPLPLNLDAVAVSPEGHVFYAGLATYGFIDPIATLGAEAAGFHETPRNGETCTPPPVFRWIPVDGVREYRVHFSPSAPALATPTPAAGTLSRVTRLHWLESPLAPADGQIWHWRVDAVTPGGLVTGPIRTFTTATGGPARNRIEVEMVKGCRAQPVDLGLPGGSSWRATATDRPWLILPADPGGSVRIDSELVPSLHERGTITLSEGVRTLRIDVDLRLHETQHLDLITDGKNSRAFALVEVPEFEDEPLDAAGANFVVQLDPVSGELRESVPVGPRAKSMFLSPDGSLLGVENAPFGNSMNPLSGGVEILGIPGYRRDFPVWSLSGSDYYGGGVQSVFGSGDLLMTGKLLLNWKTGDVIGRGDRFTPELTFFSPDGKSLYGGNPDGIYRHDATSPTLARLAVYQKRELGYDRFLMSDDGSRLAWGTLLVDANLNLVATTPAIMRDLDATASLAIAFEGLHHLPSFRKIGTLPPDIQNPTFCESTGTIVHFSGSRVSGVPRYGAIGYRDLLQIDATGLAPGIPDNSLFLEAAARLSWSNLPAAARFRVFFGTDRSAVEAAGPGSPLEVGVTSETSWNPPLPLSASTRYFWKIIAEGPGGSGASPVWSFETPSYRLSSSSLVLITPTGGPLARGGIELTAPAGMSWSLSSTTPWIRLPDPAGSGPGTLRIEADPAGLAGTQHEGVVILTIEGRAISLPVTFKTFTYRTGDVVADSDEAVMHALVSSTDPGISAANLYLVRFDMRTQLPVETVNLGISQSSSETRPNFLFLHEPEGRVYVYNNARSILVGVRADGYRVDRRIDLSAYQPPGTSLDGIAPTIDGRLLVSLPDRRTVLLCDSATGARIADVATGASGSWSFFRKGSPDGSRVYAVTSLPTGNGLRSYDVFPDRVEAGPVASQFAGFNGFNGISGDGSTIFFRSGYYDRDLRFTGESPTPFVLMNRDASRWFTSPGFSSVRWVSPDGTTLTPDLSFSATNAFATDPSGNVVFSRGGSGSAWLVIPDPAILPVIPGAKWFSSGAGAWRAPEAGVLRSPPLITAGASELIRSASLHPAFPSAGTLSFQWRNLTSGSERLSLQVNGSQNSVITANASWQSRSVTLPAGARVEWRYTSPGIAVAGSAGELRDILFTPAPALLLAAVAPSPDRDGDGAPDLLESALGSDPDQPASRPVSGITSSAGGVQFHFERPVGLAFDYQLETSTDLKVWADLDAPRSVIPLGGRERVIAILPGDLPRRFVRLRVTPTVPLNPR